MKHRRTFLTLSAGLCALAGWSAPAATLPVTTTADSGAGSLRAQIAAAASGDVIEITATGTITLTTGEIAISGKNLTLSGPGARQLSITTAATTRALHITSAACTLRGLTFANCKGFPGDVDAGGAVEINNSASASLALITTIEDCAFTGNQSGWGGALDVYNGGLVLSGCTFSGNSCSGTAISTAGGGGALSIGPTVPSFITNCTFSANSQTGEPAPLRGGGAIYNFGAVAADPPPLVISHCTFVGNVDAAGAAGAIRGNFTGSYVTVENLTGSLLVNNQAPAGTLQNFGADTAGTLPAAFASAGGNITDEVVTSTSVLTGTNDVVDSAAVAASVGVLTDNGGPTLTHDIAHSSPAKDRAILSEADTDQRGAPRAGIADAGAFELIEPELEVTVSGVAVVWQDSVAFGPTEIGTSVTRTVSVTNTQTSAFVTGPATLGGLTLPDGYTASGFLPGALANGQSRSFDVTLTADTAGIFSGPLSLTASGASVDGPFLIGLDGTVTAAAGPIDAWREEHFGPGATNTGDAADEANPIHDGVTNLLKYALGLDPAENTPLTSRVTFTHTPDGCLCLSVQRDPAATDVTLVVEVTSDLGNPTSWTATETTVDVDTPSQLTVHDNLSATTATRRFMRLRVSR